MYKYKNGILLTLFDGKQRWLLPVFSHFLTDWPEGQKVLSVYEGAGVSKCNCRVCMAPTANFGDTHLGCSKFRRRTAEATEKLRELERYILHLPSIYLAST